MDPNLDIVEPPKQFLVPEEHSPESSAILSAEIIQGTDRRPKSPAVDLGDPLPSITADTLPALASELADLSNVLPIRAKSDEPHVLVTDDNAINRKVTAVTRANRFVCLLTLSSF